MKSLNELLRTSLYKKFISLGYGDNWRTITTVFDPFFHLQANALLQIYLGEQGEAKQRFKERLKVALSEICIEPTEENIEALLKAYKEDFIADFPNTDFTTINKLIP